MVHLSVPLTAGWMAAAGRAIEDRTSGRRPVANGKGRWLVPSVSEPGKRHEVRIIDLSRLDASCTCVHGQTPKAAGHCRHIASALMSEIERVSRPQPPASEMAAKMARFSRAA